MVTAISWNKNKWTFRTGYLNKEFQSVLFIKKWTLLRNSFKWTWAWVLHRHKSNLRTKFTKRVNLTVFGDFVEMKPGLSGMNWITRSAWRCRLGCVCRSGCRLSLEVGLSEVGLWKLGGKVDVVRIVMVTMSWGGGSVGCCQSNVHRCRLGTSIDRLDLTFRA